MADTKFRVLTTVLSILTLCLLTLYGGISHAGVSGTRHDLSIFGPVRQFQTTQVCVFCHTPHGGNSELHQSTYWNSAGYQNQTGQGAFMLWNRALSSLPAQGYATYQSSTLDVDTGQVRAYSLMCMSCHDGVSAMNVMTNQPNETVAFWGGDDPFTPAGTDIRDNNKTLDPIPPTQDQIGDLCVDCGVNIGDMNPATSNNVINLANDHPVSFDYLATHPDVTAGGLKNPSSIPTALKLFPNPSGSVVSVECSTCHNPHEWGTGPQRPFLRMSNVGSALCLGCHNK